LYSKAQGQRRSRATLGDERRPLFEP